MAMNTLEKKQPNLILATMSKVKKPSRAAVQKPAQRTGKALSVYLDPDILEAIKTLAEDNVRTYTAEISLAIVRHLHAEGRLPRGEKTDRLLAQLKE